jgi:hypothetical protein
VVPQLVLVDLLLVDWLADGLAAGLAAGLADEAAGAAHESAVNSTVVQSLPRALLEVVNMFIPPFWPVWQAMKLGLPLNSSTPEELIENPEVGAAPTSHWN